MRNCAPTSSCPDRRMVRSEFLLTRPQTLRKFVTWITAPGESRFYAPRHGGSGIHRLRGDQHMHDDRELSIDELSAVVGGATSTGGGFHPQPSPVDQFIKWLLDALRVRRRQSGVGGQFA